MSQQFLFELPPTIQPPRMCAKKHNGTVGELVFAAEATRRGYTVSVPFGEMDKYDCIIDQSGYLTRVQVKTTTRVHSCTDAYQLQLSHGSKGAGKSYDLHDFDVLVAYAIKINQFYMLPVSKVAGKQGFPLTHKYDCFRDNWGIFDCQ